VTKPSPGHSIGNACSLSVYLIIGLLYGNKACRRSLEVSGPRPLEMSASRNGVGDDERTRSAATDRRLTNVLADRWKVAAAATVPACLLTLGKRTSRDEDWLSVRSNMHCFERLRLMVSCLCACARNISDHENRTQGGRAALHEVLLTRPDIHGEVSTGL
jgi:hypothetical protein